MLDQRRIGPVPESTRRHLPDYLKGQGMNPQLLIASQAAAAFNAADALAFVTAIAIFGLALLAAQAFFLAIERFRELNNRDQEQRTREAMLLAAERARLQREFELSQAWLRG